MACGVEMSSVENNYPVENMNNRTRRAKKQKGDENKNFQENMESDESRNWEDHNDNGGNSPYNKRSRNGDYLTVYQESTVSQVSVSTCLLMDSNSAATNFPKISLRTSETSAWDC